MKIWTNKIKAPALTYDVKGIFHIAAVLGQVN